LTVSAGEGPPTASGCNVDIGNSTHGWRLSVGSRAVPPVCGRARCLLRHKDFATARLQPIVSGRAPECNRGTHRVRVGVFDLLTKPDPVLSESAMAVWQRATPIAFARGPGLESAQRSRLPARDRTTGDRWALADSGLLAVFQTLRMAHRWPTNSLEPVRMDAERCAGYGKGTRRLRLARAKSRERCGSARMPEEGLEPPTRGL